MSQTQVQIPNDYNSWKAMMTNDCKESLTAEFVDERLKVLRSSSDPFTKKFLEIYGKDYLNAVISWYERAKSDLN